MTRFSGWLFLSLLLLGPLTCAAQDASEQPTPPFMIAPTDATWTITVRALGASAQAGKAAAPGSSSAPVELTERRVSQKGSVRQEISVWSDGSTSEAWIVGHMRLMGLPSNRGIRLVDPRRDPITEVEAESADFLTITWLALDDYVGFETYEGHKCYHFRKPVPHTPLKLAAASSPESDLADHMALLARAPGEAWIDKDTKLMVAYNDGSKLYTYTFGPPPAGDLVPPPAFTNLLKEYRQDMNPLNIPVAPH